MNVFEPAAIGSLQLRNRILLAPVKTALAQVGGAVTEPLIAYYARRARGGVGAVIVEPFFVDSTGKEHPKQLGIEHDERVEGLSRLVDEIHAHGAMAIAHINHAGRAANPKATGKTPEAPSAVPCGTTGATPEAMSTARIGELVISFGEAARRAREAGFDAVELQAGLGYLLAQFFSSRTNQRTDEYGGDLEQRERFAKEVVAAVRAALRDELPLVARISASEKVEGGLGLDEAHHLGSRLVEWGVDALHVVTGSACDTPPFYYQHMSLPPGINEKLAAAVRARVEVPVIVAGRLGAPATIEQVIGDATADFVALGRPLVADPDLPLKMQEHREGLVTQCGSCLQGCLANVKAGKGIGCIVNPEAGHELEVVDEDGTASGHIVVVGGGPAGMTATTVLRRRGFRVTLIERGTLGGQFSLAPLAPGKAAMHRPLDSLVRQTEASGAEIRVGETATAEGIRELAPDAVIVASGAQPVALAVPGLEDARTGNEVLSRQVEVGQHVLVVGGGLVGLETAEFLAESGKKVTVVELLDEVGRDMEMITRKMTMARMSRLPVELHTKTSVERLEEGWATIEHNGAPSRIGPFDDVVVAVGTRPEAGLLEELEGVGIPVHAIGDVLEPNQVMGAVQSGWEVAVSLSGKR